MERTLFTPPEPGAADNPVVDDPARTRADREERLREARAAIERLPAAERIAHWAHQNRMKKFLAHVVNHDALVSCVQDSRDLLAEGKRDEMDMVEWHDLNAGPLSIDYTKGTRRESFLAAPTHWMVLCGLILIFAAFAAADMFDLKLPLLIGNDPGGFGLGVMTMLLCITLMTLPVVRKIRFINAKLGTVSVSYRLRLFNAAGNADAAAAASMGREEAVEGFVDGHLSIHEGFLRLSGMQVLPENVREISATAWPQGLLALLMLGALAALAWVVGVGLAWLAPSVPLQGFWAGLLRAAGYVAIIACVGGGGGSVFVVIYGIVFGLWHDVRHDIKLRMNDGRTLTVGACNWMHQDQVLDAVTSRIAAARRPGVES